MSKTKLLIIGGCTASGKSKLALELSKLINMEIISADSIQVYKQLEKGTSKPTIEEQKMCKHHLIDVVEPDENFNAFNFVTLAKQAIQEIYQNNKLPVIVGGTGLYIESLIYNYSFENKNENLNQSEYDFKLYVLHCERNKLYQLINERVDKMIESGLVEEVKDLKNKGYENCQCMQAIGYKELIFYINGQTTLNDAIELIKKRTRNYAKRQITWFKHMKNAIWVDTEKDLEKIKAEILKEFSEFKK